MSDKYVVVSTGTASGDRITLEHVGPFDTRHDAEVYAATEVGLPGWWVMTLAEPYPETAPPGDIERGQHWTTHEDPDGETGTPVYVIGTTPSADQRFTIVTYEFELTDGYYSLEERDFRQEYPVFLYREDLQHEEEVT